MRHPEPFLPANHAVWRRRAAPAGLLWVLLLLAGAPALRAADPPRRAAGTADPVIAAAGDIACDPADPNYNGGAGTSSFCRMKATSDLLVGAGLAAVLGARRQPVRERHARQPSRPPTTRPGGGSRRSPGRCPGNHEYLTPGAAGYFAYFGAAGGRSGQGLLQLRPRRAGTSSRSTRTAPPSAAAAPARRRSSGSRADLAAQPGVCTLAYWHHPRFSSGPARRRPDLRRLLGRPLRRRRGRRAGRPRPRLRALRAADPAGAADPARGIRQFVVGTGGKNHTPFATGAAEQRGARAPTPSGCSS